MSKNLRVAGNYIVAHACTLCLDHLRPESTVSSAGSIFGEFEACLERPYLSSATHIHKFSPYLSYKMLK